MGVWKSFAATIVAVALSLPLLAGAKELKVGLKLEESEPYIREALAGRRTGEGTPTDTMRQCLRGRRL